MSPSWTGIGGFIIYSYTRGAIWIPFDRLTSNTSVKDDWCPSFNIGREFLLLIGLAAIIHFVILLSHVNRIDGKACSLRYFNFTLAISWALSTTVLYERKPVWQLAGPIGEQN